MKNDFENKEFNGGRDLESKKDENIQEKTQSQGQYKQPADVQEKIEKK